MFFDCCVFVFLFGLFVSCCCPTWSWVMFERQPVAPCVRLPEPWPPSHVCVSVVLSFQSGVHCSHLLSLSPLSHQCFSRFPLLASRFTGSSNWLICALIQNANAHVLCAMWLDFDLTCGVRQRQNSLVVSRVSFTKIQRRVTMWCEDVTMWRFDNSMHRSGHDWVT